MAKGSIPTRWCRHRGPASGPGITGRPLRPAGETFGRHHSRWHRREVPVTDIFTAWLVLAAVGATAVAVDITLALRRPDNRLRTALLGSLAWLVVGLAFTAGGGGPRRAGGGAPGLTGGPPG